MLVGIVGKPNVGKSTFFKALTLASVEIANYPFATIKPNHGAAHVKLKCASVDFGKQATPREGYMQGEHRFVPVDVMDVAGLVPGAHKGKGLGNQFLDDLRQADVLIQVVDVSGSTNEKGEPVESGSHDVVEDVLFLEEELDQWLLGILTKSWEKFSKSVAVEKIDTAKAIAKQFSFLGLDIVDTKEILKATKLEKPLSSWSEQELKQIASHIRMKTKPLIIAANKCDTATAEQGLKRLQEHFPDYLVIPVSAESELALKEAEKQGFINYVSGDNTFLIQQQDKLSTQQQEALNLIQRSVLDVYGSTGVQECLNKAVFDVLHYIAVFPGGVNNLVDSEGRVLPDCFLMPPGTTALSFAYRLHTDFGKNFVKAVDVRTKRPIGKEQLLKHRDVIEIMSSK